MTHYPYRNLERRATLGPLTMPQWVAVLIGLLVAYAAYRLVGEIQTRFSIAVIVGGLVGAPLFVLVTAELDAAAIARGMIRWPLLRHGPRAGELGEPLGYHLLSDESLVDESTPPPSTRARRRLRDARARA